MDDDDDDCNLIKVQYVTVYLHDVLDIGVYLCVRNTVDIVATLFSSLCCFLTGGCQAAV